MHTIQLTGNDAPASSKRDTTIDSMRGIGIALMVAVHAGAPFSSFINLFHMPLFLVASGFFWRDKDAESPRDLIHLLKRMLRSLWLPFVLFNGTLVLLHNALLAIGAYTSNPEILTIAPVSQQQIQQSYGPSTMCLEFVKTILFMHLEQLGGPTWFLRSLFIVKMVFALVRHADISVFLGKYNFTVAMTFGCAIAATLISYTGMILPVGMSSIPACFIAYALGVFIRKADYDSILSTFTNNKLLATSLLSCMCLCCCTLIGEVAMYKGSITNALFLVLTSSAGWIMLRSIAMIMGDGLRKLTAVLGRESMCVLMLHLPCFKLVSALYVLFFSQRTILLAVNPSIRAGIPLCIAYTVVGVILPLAINFAWLTIRERCDFGT